MLTKEQFDAALIGDEIGFVDGPGQSPFDKTGRVVRKIEDRWGRHLAVKFDPALPDGRTSDTVHGFTKVGIGCYNLKELR